mgnify:CR=1 FL=1
MIIKEPLDHKEVLFNLILREKRMVEYNMAYAKSTRRTRENQF